MITIPTKGLVYTLSAAIPLAVSGICYGLLINSSRLTNASLGVILIASVLALILVAIDRIVFPPYYGKAYKAFQDGKFSEALDLINKSIHSRPQSHYAFALRAQIYILTRQLDNARKDAEYYLTLDPDTWYGHWLIGQCYYYAEKYEQAIEAYTQVVQRNPKDSLPFCSIGVVYYRIGKPECAIDYLRRAATLKGEEVCKFSSHYYLGRCLEEVGQEEQADEVFAKMVKYSDGFIQLRENLKRLPDDDKETSLLREEVKDMRELIQEFRDSWPQKTP